MTVFRIARHELRQAWRNGTLVALGIVITLLLAGAGIVGLTRYALDQAQRERFQAMVWAQWREQPDRHPHRVSHYGYLVFRPRAPLGFFDSGLESFTGTSIFLEAHRQNSANLSDVTQDAGTRRFGELTMAMVLQLLVPLLLVSAAGVSVVRERETGTLALLLSQTASWRAFLWGKVWGSLLTVACLVVPGVVVAAAWGISRSNIAWTPDLIARAILLAGSHAAYLAACAGLAVLVSSRHRSSRGALVTLVGLWLVLWVIVPRALPGLAAALYPLPSRAAFEADIERSVRRLGDSHNPDDPTFAGLRARTLAEHGVSRVEDLPFNYNGVVMSEGEKMTAAAYGDHVTQLLDIHARHARLVGVAGFLSPYVAMRTLSTSLAGVDLPHAVEFERQAEEYRYALIQHLNVLHTNEVDLARDRYSGAAEISAPTRARIGREHWQSTPSATFTVPSVVWAVERQPLGALGLLWWSGLAAVTLTLAARRIPAA